MCVGAQDNVAFMDWKQDYSVGMPDIDQQHKQLLAIINRLHDVMKAGSPHVQLMSVVNELVDYTHQHFAYEERMLIAAKYPDVEEHIRKHRSMTTQVAAYREKVRDDKASAPLQLMEFLKAWLSHHILDTDMQYSRSMQQLAQRSLYEKNSAN